MVARWVIATLRERARRGDYTLTPGLHRVVPAYFGGAEAARVPPASQALATFVDVEIVRPNQNGAGFGFESRSPPSGS